ncbi:hypothetical protein DL96DRAFT_1595972 [Flagelloscypha sp. PMI_526]|nr:hypothetical protein DL96DRAFT_1595972 [Flagelloscypha sp. PMI_526]
MEVSRNLPLDILRLLLEYSASTRFESARVLSLVSKEVQSWTDPHFFQTVNALFYSGKYAISSLDRMCMPDASPRLVLARNYVRAVAWRSYVPKPFYVKQALENFPDLAQVCIWSTVFPFQPEDTSSQSSLRPFVITQMYPPLRRVATCIDGLSTVPPNAFGSPFWTTVTHLHLNYYRALSLPDSPFQQAFFNEDDFELAFTRVTANLPPSLKLCLLALTPSRDSLRRPWLAKMVTISQNFDKRIVMWSRMFVDNSDELVGTSDEDNFQAWCKFQDGAHTYWEMGEDVLKKRRGRLRPV